jgi:hypothetical protein
VFELTTVVPAELMKVTVESMSAEIAGPSPMKK